MPLVSVESLLLSFDAILGICDPAQRPAAAGLLRDTAAGSQNPENRERLLQAAAAVEAGKPCAYTAEGLTGAQAAAAQTVTSAQWEARMERTIGEPAQQEDVEEEDAGDDEDSYLEEPPPQLPHLPVRHFFQGLRVRAGRDFSDARGRAVCEGSLLSLLVAEPEAGGVYNLSFLDRNLRLTEAEILENAGNLWFQPVASRDCLEDLLFTIHETLDKAEQSDELEDEDVERLDEIRAEVIECEEWLSDEEARAPAPSCKTATLAAKVMGRDHALAAWLRLLFAAVKVAQ